MTSSMTDLREQARLARALELQGRLFGALAPRSWPSVDHLFRSIRSYLIAAANQRVLVQGPNEIFKWLRKSDTPKTGNTVPGSTHSIAYGEGVNFRRDPALPHLRRKADSAWFDFQLSIRAASDSIEILAYDFELRFHEEDRPLHFFRIDMNHDAHANAHQGHRSHLHLSSDDDGFVVPAAVLNPFELLDTMLFGAMRVGRKRGQKQS